MVLGLPTVLKGCLSCFGGRLPGDATRPHRVAARRANRGATEHAGGARTRQAGHRKSPINVREPLAPRGGKNQPTPKEATEEDRDPIIRIIRESASAEQSDEDTLLPFVLTESSRCQTLLELVELDVEGFLQDPDDPKGKKAVEEPRPSSPGCSLMEAGESSSAPPSQPEAYCSICMEPKFSFECFSMKGCTHVYCSACVSQYVAAKIQDNMASIGCPDLGCKDGVLEPEMCRLILPQDVFDRWGSMLCEAVILRSMKFYCPYKDCSALLIDEGGDDGKPITMSECPHCCRLLCVQCKVPWHTGINCGKYRELGADEREREDLMLRQVAEKSKWQRCPKCKFYVERTEGCMFIKCRCGFKFCYGCAKEMKISHYCSKCKC